MSLLTQSLLTPRSRRDPRGWLRPTLALGVPIVIGGIVLACVELLTRSQLNQGTNILILMLIAMAWNLVGGYGGQFSLGHSVFIGLGGYSVALVMDYAALPMPVVLLAAGVVAAVAGVVLGYPMLRLRGPYFAIGTLGVALAVTAWMMNWEFTKASRSYTIAPSKLLGYDELFATTLSITTLVLVAITAVVMSPLGLRLVALRDDERGATSLGVRRVRTILPVWAFSGFATGLAGALIALQKGSVTPAESFSPAYSLDAIVIAVIGGLGTLYGPLVGAVILYVLKQVTADLGQWSLLIEALLLILVVRLVPGGVWSLLARGWRFVVRVVRRAPRA